MSKEFIGLTVLPGLGGEVLRVLGGGGGVTGVTWVGGKGWYLLVVGEGGVLLAGVVGWRY